MAHPNTRRSTLSGQRPLIPAQPRPRNSAITCTHLTMTRLYTTDFRCTVCLRKGAFGWLYRCSQDRELLLDDDCDHGWAVQDHFDLMYELFPRPDVPRKRGPVAMMDKLAFLSEMTEEQEKTYTPEQIELILKQRAHALEVCCRPEFTPLQPDILSFASRFSSGGLDRSLSTSSKPWLPLRGGECQFKCCHTCRPSFRERAYVSLNGVVNDDTPLTAITGFGFHLAQQRPVMPAEIVKNIGLRPSPRIGPDSQLITQPQHTTSPLKRRPIVRLPSGLGLGILADITPDGTLPLPINPTSIPTLELPISPNAVTPQLEILAPLLTPTSTARRHTITHHTSTSGSRVALSMPLPEQDEREVELINVGLGATAAIGFIADAEVGFVDRFTAREGARSRSGFRDDDEEDITESEYDAHFDAVIDEDMRRELDVIKRDMAEADIDVEMAAALEAALAAGKECAFAAGEDGEIEAGILLLTPMEERELKDHVFGGKPLEVEGGVAVLEESVELHCPDVITQF